MLALEDKYKSQAQAVSTSPTHLPNLQAQVARTPDMSLPQNQAPQLTAHIGVQFILAIVLPIIIVIGFALGLFFFVVLPIQRRRALAATGKTDVENGKADDESLSSGSNKSKTRSESSSEEEYMMTRALSSNSVQVPLQPHF